METEHKSGWTVDTLLALMDERNLRYEQHFRSAEEAVKLAKQAADQARGTVNISLLVAFISMLIGIIALFLTASGRLT